MIGSLSFIERKINYSDPIDYQQKIAEAASAQEGSKKWAYSTAKGTLPAETNKCTLFVHDSINTSGLTLDLQDQGYSKYIPFIGTTDTPYTAEQWTNGEVPSFSAVSTAQAGDIASYAHDYANATGHAGIVGYNSAGQLGVFNAGSTVVKWSSFSSFFAGHKQSFMRYTGN